MTGARMNFVHFATASAFRRWLDQNHATATELVVAFHRKSAGQPGLTYPEAVDEALCFGWIDGIVRKIDADRFTHRFTRRRPAGIWSNVNVRHVARLTAAGKMHAAGLRAFAARRDHRTGIYSYERRDPKPRAQTFPVAMATVFRRATPAWRFWLTLPPGYQRTVIHWITSARQEPTRPRRLTRLIAASTAGRRL